MPYYPHRRTKLLLASLLSQSKKVLEALRREVEVPWDAVEEERGEVKEDERSQVERKIQEEVWLSRLKPYLEKVRSMGLLPIGAPRYRVARPLEILTGGEDLLIHRHHKFQVSTLLEILPLMWLVVAITQFKYIKPDPPPEPAETNK